ncbi:MAG: thioesterase family protein [Anaerolineales bacterium]|nr:thioesterase family protein [Anaerolineales bacterium]
MKLKTGLSIEKTITVKPEQTAFHVGSGDLRVFATPEMVWLLESVCTELLADCLDEGETSVGVVVNVRHLAPTPVGMKVTVRAELTKIESNQISFQVALHDELEKIGEADHVRAVIDSDRFLKRIESKRGVS